MVCYCNLSDRILDNPMFRYYLDIISPNLPHLTRDTFRNTYLSKLQIQAEEENNSS